MGTANIAVSAVIPALKQSKKVMVKAIASRNGEKARQLAKELLIDTFYGSYREMLDG